MSNVESVSVSTTTHAPTATVNTSSAKAVKSEVDIKKVAEATARVAADISDQKSRSSQEIKDGNSSRNTDGSQDEKFKLDQERPSQRMEWKLGGSQRLNVRVIKENAHFETI